jgi:hypothetical protein
MALTMLEKTSDSADLSAWLPAIAAEFERERTNNNPLALLRREGFCRTTQSDHPIQLLVRALTRGGTDECTLSG